MGKIDISYVGFGPKGTSWKIDIENESLNDHKQCQQWIHTNGQQDIFSYDIQQFVSSKTNNLLSQV